jgi:TRAP-type mannitol/chloroaromatic compound transport system permease small subunit
MTDQREPTEGEPHVDVDDLIHHTVLPRTPVSNFLDTIIRWTGYAASWFCWFFLVGIIVVNVVMRYFFGEGKIYFEEAQSFIYALGFLIGLSFCVENDSHIRIDIFHDRFKPRTKAWIDFIGILFFLIPYVTVILIYSVPMIEYSLQTGEQSTSPGGLPYPLITIWKSFMFIGYALLMIAAVSRLIRVSTLLFWQPSLNSSRR